MKLDRKERLTEIDVQKIADRIGEALQACPDLKLAFLYGSAVTGKMRTDSDVDIAVLFDHPLGAEQKMALGARFEEALLKTIDLVDLFSLNGTILKQILCEGRVVVKKSKEDMTRLTRRMIYNQADMMPYVRRTLLERQKRFVHGS